MLVLSDAYLQILVEECSKLLLTLKELLKYNRLSFGIKVIPSIFQQIMDSILAGLDCGLAYLDDILIKNETGHQHLEDVK